MGSSKNNPEDDDLAYLEKLDRFLEGKEQTTLYLELEKKGEPPNLQDDLSDEEITRELTNLVWALYDQHVVIEFTDHLSDRELYYALREYCDEPICSVAGFKNAWNHWSPIGAGTEEDAEISLQYYDDEESRQWWVEQFPDTVLPPSELPLYPRPWIPKAVYVDADGNDLKEAADDSPF